MPGCCAFGRLPAGAAILARRAASWIRRIATRFARAVVIIIVVVARAVIVSIIRIVVARASRGGAVAGALIAIRGGVVVHVAFGPGVVLAGHRRIVAVILII